MTNVPTKAFARPCLTLGGANWSCDLVRKSKFSALAPRRATEKITIPRIKTASAAASQATNSITRLTTRRRRSLSCGRCSTLRSAALTGTTPGVARSAAR